MRHQPPEITPSCPLTDSPRRQNGLQLILFPQRARSSLSPRSGCRTPQTSRMAHASTSRLIACTCGALRSPPSPSTTFGRRAFGSSSRTHGPLMPLRSVLDLFTGIRATPTAQLPPPEEGGSQLSRRESLAMERKVKAEGGGLFSKFMKGKAAAPMDYEEVMRRRNSEMQKALERTLGGGRGSGASGMEIRCTTLDEKGAIVVGTALNLKLTHLSGRLGNDERSQARAMRSLRYSTARSPQTRFWRSHCHPYHSRPKELYNREVLLVSGPSCSLTIAAAAHHPTLEGRHHCEGGHPVRLHWIRGHLAQGDFPLPPAACTQDQYQGCSWIAIRISVSHQAAEATAPLADPSCSSALESCLISVTTALETELVNIRALVLDLLQELESHIGARNALIGWAELA